MIGLKENVIIGRLIPVEGLDFSENSEKEEVEAPQETVEEVTTKSV